MTVRANRVRFLAGILPLVVVILAAFHTKTSAAQKASGTIFYTHGRIYTNDPAQPWAEAMAVSEGKITCIGKMAHILLDCGGSQEGAETVHLEGQFVMPGFNDAHVHLGGAAADELAVPLTGVPSVEEMQKRVAAAVARHKEGEWITGGGWSMETFPGGTPVNGVADQTGSVTVSLPSPPEPYPGGLVTASAPSGQTQETFSAQSRMTSPAQGSGQGADSRSHCRATPQGN